MAGEVAIYRYSDTRLYWLRVDQSGSGNVYARFVRSDLVHLHGLYDSDTKTDVVVYEPETARFFMSLSTRNWDPAQAVLRTFDASLRPDAIAASSAGASAALVRHGGIAVPAEKVGRRVLRVMDAYAGTWHTMWDPINSASVWTCGWGTARDVPLPGPIDRNGDSRTDLIVFRPTPVPSTIYFHSNTLCTYGSGTLSLNTGAASSRSTVSAVLDMSGDGLGDVLVLDPDQYSWQRYYSQPGGSFASQALVYLGGPGAVPL